MSISKIPVEDIEPKTKAVQMTEDFFYAYNNPHIFSDEERVYARKHMRSIILDQMDAEFKAGITNIPARQMTTPCPSPFLWDWCWFLMVMSSASFSAYSAMASACANGDGFFGIFSYIAHSIIGIVYVGLPYCFFTLSYDEHRVPNNRKTFYTIALIVYTYILCWLFSAIRYQI